MDTLLPFALLCFTSFFTLTNPLGTMPVFLQDNSFLSSLVFLPMGSVLQVGLSFLRLVLICCRPGILQ